MCKGTGATDSGVAIFLGGGATLWHIECPSQRSDPSHRCDLSCSCSNTGSLTHCAGCRSNLQPSTPKTPITLGTPGVRVCVCVCVCVLFLGQHPRHMEVPRLWVELELQLLAYTTATQHRIRVTSEPTPQLMSMPNPWPTGRGQELNPHPHGH